MSSSATISSSTIHPSGILSVTYPLITDQGMQGQIILKTNGRRVRKAYLYHQGRLMSKTKKCSDGPLLFFILSKENEIPELFISGREFTPEDSESCSKTRKSKVIAQMSVTLQMDHRDPSCILPSLEFSGKVLPESTFRESKLLETSENLYNVMFFDNGIAGFVWEKGIDKESFKKEYLNKMLEKINE